MKVIGVISNSLFESSNDLEKKTVDIAGNVIKLGVVDVQKPFFDEKNPKNANFLLLKVNAFSCNYRDKALILKAALKDKNKELHVPPISYFGSDFVATIVAKGKNVSELEIGARVIPDCSFPESPYPGVAAGVVTNEASKGWLIIHKAKIQKIPENLSDSKAAGFTIGAQTSHSMVRRVNLKPEEKALVLSGKSNTSLFIISQLNNIGINTFILSTSNWTKEEKSFVYPAKVIYIPRGKLDWEDFLNGEKFDAVFDPFFDLHLLSAVKVMNPYGRYITCGFKNQHKEFKDDKDDFRETETNEIMLTTMIKNLDIMGNCIGTRDDLSSATMNHSQYKIPIDRIFDTDNISEFVNRTYNADDRFGKVIMVYK